jgi:hypothetical protein
MGSGNPIFRQRTSPLPEVGKEVEKPPAMAAFFIGSYSLPEDVILHAFIAITSAHYHGDIMRSESAVKQTIQLNEYVTLLMRGCIAECKTRSTGSLGGIGF